MVESINDHVPVLLEQSVKALDLKPGEVVLDCTFGRGGHTKRFLAAVGADGLVVGLDVDRAALLAAKEIVAPNFRFVAENFRNLDLALRTAGIQQVDKIFFDLGVSSPQLDEGARGFSYRMDAPLDMRLDPSMPHNAEDLVNRSSEGELAKILWDFGEERWAKRIASFVVLARVKTPIKSTLELVEIIRAAVPKAVRQAEDQHPARRTFQALRIAVNDELGALKDGLEKGLAALRTGGRLGCIAFHSLEDRIVKQFMSHHARECLCPQGVPQCVCQHRAEVKLVTKKPLAPTPDEVRDNPRSRSAHLRVIEKLPRFD